MSCRAPSFYVRDVTAARDSNSARIGSSTRAPAERSGWWLASGACGACVLALQVLLLHQAPVRLALNSLPFAVCFLLAWAVACSSGHIRTGAVALALLCVGAAVPALRDDRTFRAASLSTPASPAIWSTSLETPQRALEVNVRLPPEMAARPAGGAPLHLIVRLDRQYRGYADLSAEVNDIPIGPLQPPPPEFTPDPDYSLRLAPIPPAALASRDVTRVVLRQTTTDSTLRLVTYGQWRGASMAATAVNTFDGARWHPGVLREGTWVMAYPSVQIGEAP